MLPTSSGCYAHFPSTQVEPDGVGLSKSKTTLSTVQRQWPILSRWLLRSLVVLIDLTRLRDIPIMPNVNLPLAHLLVVVWLPLERPDPLDEEHRRRFVLPRPLLEVVPLVRVVRHVGDLKQQHGIGKSLILLFNFTKMLF